MYLYNLDITGEPKEHTGLFRGICPFTPLYVFLVLGPVPGGVK